jgi:hypothetical protein
VRQILILASSPREAGHYAKRADLPNFTYRAVHSAKQIRGIHSAEVHILPSFIASVSRHAILAELQWARSVEFFYVDPEDMPELPDRRGELTDEKLEEAYDEQDRRRRDRVLTLSPEEFDRVMAELDKPAEVIPAIAQLAEKVKASPEAVKSKARKPVEPTAYFS